MNPPKKEVAGMFNYTSDGDGLGNFITNGVYEMEDEDGTSQYFRGTMDNLVQFREYEEDYYTYNLQSYHYEGNDYLNPILDSEVITTSMDVCDTMRNKTPSATYYQTCTKTLRYTAGSPMYWRIVRINGDGTLRLIYNGISKNAMGDDVVVGYSKNGLGILDNYYFNPKYAAYTFDNGTDSALKKSVDGWYNSALANSSYDKYVVNGRFCSDTSGDSFNETNDMLTTTHYFNSVDRLSSPSDYKPTLICPDTTSSAGGRYRLKAGLISADELKLSSKNLFYTDISYWTMIPAGGGNIPAWTWISNLADLGTSSNNNTLGIRPVINVNLGQLKLSGNGSSDDPYVLQPSN